MPGCLLGGWLLPGVQPPASPPCFVLFFLWFPVLTSPAPPQGPRQALSPTPSLPRTTSASLCHSCQPGCDPARVASPTPGFRNVGQRGVSGRARVGMEDKVLSLSSEAARTPALGPPVQRLAIQVRVAGAVGPPTTRAGGALLWETDRVPVGMRSQTRLLEMAGSRRSR